MQLLFNVLAISGSASFAGVMITIGLTLGGYWKSLPPGGFIEWFSGNNQFITRPIPYVVLPSLVGVLGSLWLGWGEAGPRLFWLGATLCIGAVLALTIAWFVPNNARFAAKAVPIDEVPARLNAWLMLHGFRIALAMIASVLGILAVGL